MLVTLCTAQEKIRIVEGPPERYRNQPIEIVGWELRDREFIDKNRVVADKDWIRDLTISVKNVSERSIRFFNVNIQIRKKGMTLLAIPTYFYTRIDPNGDSSLTVEGKKKIGFLQPGETVKVKVSDDVMSFSAKEMVKLGVEDIDQVRIDIRAVYFEDGNRWMFGMESRPDPNDPAKHIPINRPEPEVSYRVTEWLKDIVPKDQSYSNNLFHWMVSGWLPDFFISKGYETVSSEAPACVWYVHGQLTRPTCSTFTTYNGCTGDDTSCVYDNYQAAIYSSDPGGEAAKGYMTVAVHKCYNPQSPIGPTCGSCNNFNHDTFESYPDCGSPGTCNQTAWWGCAEGFVDIEGVCQRSVEYQQTCRPPAGFDSLTCSCPNGVCPTHCPEGYVLDPIECLCVFDGGGTPVVLDVLGNGFSLTDARNGVNFDLNVDGTRERIGWTAVGTDDVWLVLDRNSNGRIDDGSELFGDFTPQPEPPPGEQRNGFLALADYDKPENGGNSDGVISKQDAVFNSLRLWRDSDHNGRSRPSELFRLQELGLRKIHLDYQTSRRVDEFGNQFRWRARVKDANDAQLGRWAYDVILVTR